MRLQFSLLILVYLLGACTAKSNSPSAPLTPEQEAEKLMSRGKMIYNTQCISCHNSDPKKDGSVGPAIFGSSLELLEAKVLRNEYPAGHTPKRPSRMMVALPHLKNEIPALHLYLNSPSL